MTNIDFYENDLLRTLGIAVHNLLRLQKPEAIAYTACYPRDVAGAQPSATDYHKNHAGFWLVTAINQSFAFGAAPAAQGQLHSAPTVSRLLDGADQSV